MSSPYFGGKTASMVANERAPVKVSLPKKKPPPKKVPLPPTLNPKGDKRFVTVREHQRAIPVKKAAPVVNTAKAEPATKHGESKRFYKPLSPGQKPSGYEPAGRRPGRAGIGSPVKSRPYWLATRGPVGDTKSQLSSAQLKKAEKAGPGKSAGIKALDAAVHPLTDLGRQASGARPFSAKGAVSDVANIASNFVGPEKAGAAAGIFGLGKALKGAKVAEEAAVAGKAAEKVKPYVNTKYADHGVGSVPGLAHEKGYLYHRTDEPGFKKIEREGLKATQPRGDKPAGVYFGRHPLEARGLSQKSIKGSMYVRVKKDAVPTVDFKGDARLSGPEVLSPSSVEPHHLEYLGEDGKWHPVVGKADVPEAPAAALRGAVSGKPARQALKTMGPYEKTGAKLADPNYGKSVRTLQKEQKALYSQERAKRAAAARRHLDNPNLTPEDRVRLAKHELKGELPKIKFQGFTELSDQAVTAMQTHILDHPHLMPFQKITASDALRNALTGKLPTPSELKLLEHVFGKDTTAGLGGIAKHPFKDTILSVLNVPRSIMSSFDLSAPFRQGLLVSTRHPKIFAQNFKPMVKSFGSEKVYKAAIAEIKARPTYPAMIEAKLSLTDLGHALGDREEQFASDVAEKLTGGRRSPIRASGRAYTGFLDKTRADVFDHLMDRAAQQGINVQDPEFLKGLGKYINSATGRGDLGAFAEAGKVLNTFFFSPKLLASRLNFLNPLYYKRLHPFARKEALRSALQLAGTLSTLLALASQVKGVKVIQDPRNPDWGKIRLGNTRLDIAGGFQQHLRLLAQLATGTAISSTTGKRLNLTASKFGNPNRLDILTRFFEGKASPLASFGLDYLRGQDQIGNKFDLKTEITSRMIPLLAQDAHDLYKEKHGGLNGLAAAFAGYGVGSVGIGMQTYGSQPAKGPTKKPQQYFGSSPSTGGGGSYFASPASSSSGGGYFGTP